MIKKIVLLLSLSLLSLWSIDIDETIVKGDTNYYEKLLYQINQSKQTNDEITFQKTLLYKLINLTSADGEEILLPKPPENSHAYKKLFNLYLETSLTKTIQNQRLQEMREHKKSIKRQLELMTTKDPALLSRQLQYAFYDKGERIYRAKLDERRKLLSDLPALFIQSLPKITFNLDQIRSEESRLQNELEQIKAKIQKFRLDKERLNLLEKADQAQKIDASIKYYQESQQELIQKKIVTLFELFSQTLKDKSDETFEIEKRLQEELLRYKEGTLLAEDLSALLHTMSKEVLGTAKRISGAMMTEIKNALHTLWTTINNPLFAINETHVTLFKIFIALFLFVISFYLGDLYKKAVHKYTHRKRSIKLATRTLFSNVGNYIIIIAFFFMALNILGINLSSFALIAGALSVGIGFGLQNIVSNFVAGLILMFERSIKVGDYIEITDQLRGHITDIRMRSTTINTNANIDVIVPNQDLIQKHVINWTMSDDIRRFDIPFSVAYGTETKKVKEVILDAVRESGFEDLYENPSRKMHVVMVGMNNSSVDYELLVWIKGEHILNTKWTVSRFLILIYDALYEHGIKIPFPQRDLHIESIGAEVLARLTQKENAG